MDSIQRDVIYLKIPQKKAIPITIESRRWGPNGFLIVKNNERNIFLPLAGNIATLAQALIDHGRQLQELACTRDERGIIQQQRARSRDWQTGPDRLPTLADIPTDNPRLAWQLIHKRFRNSNDESLIALAAYAAEQAAKLEKEQRTATTADTGGQLGADLQAIEALAADLLDDDGNLVWGGQTKIADALGIPNAGQSNRERILAVADALQQRKAA